jgi:hypothetical protein
VIYIKLQIKAGRIWGRSFHNSARKEEETNDAGKTEPQRATPEHF